MSDKQIKLLGWIATTMSILMYVSYIPQITGNLNGDKGAFLQPFVAGINCTLWVCYALFKKDKDLPLAGANIPGIIFGFLAAFTAL